MMSSLYIGATGMITLGEGMQVVSNNLANVNTVGFKERMALYQDLYNSYQTAGSNNITNISQQGHGVKVSAISTRHWENGGFQAGSDEMDMAISGKGFFQVTQNGKIAYTRAGNFRFTKDGYLVDPNYFTLTGKDGPIQLTAEQNIMAPKATTSAKVVNNLGMTDSVTSSATDPFFSMIGHWNGQAKTPMGEHSFGFRDEVQVVDENGETHSLQIYYDKVKADTDGRMIYQYMVAMSPTEDGRADFAGTEGAGVLAAGTMTFTASGVIQDMTAYTPTGGGANFKDLSTWQGAPIGADGLALNLSFNTKDANGNVTGATSQTLNLNLGMDSAPPSGGGSGTAAAVGANAANLPGYTAGASLPNPVNSGSMTTAYQGNSSNVTRTQDGYVQGFLSRLSVDANGVISGQYSNGHSAELFEVPLYRFINEQDLHAEGKNHFTPTTASGAAQEGRAGDENYGSIYGNSLELSNVDMARQFATMIVTQRGFQFNSKIVTTSDTMLQRAIELKR